MRLHIIKIWFFCLCLLCLILIISIIRDSVFNVKVIPKNVVSISQGIINEPQNTSSSSSWKYVCSPQGLCQRILTKSKKLGNCLKTCQMICGKPTLWPMPKSIMYDQRMTSSFNVKAVSLIHNSNSTPIEDLVKKAYTIFSKNIFRLIKIKDLKISIHLKRLIVKLKINDLKLTQLRLNTSEAYTLKSKKNGDEVHVEITSKTFFGVRHGLETLSQLIWWDEFQQTLLILYNIEIEDEPAFPYRGLMIDTSRNYFSANSIKRNLRAMAACKLNVFHWHITDSQSFPFVSPQLPILSKFGAYNKNKIYTVETIRDIIQYAKPLGIRVIIEIDAPAHMYEGWIQINNNLIQSDEGGGQLNPDSKLVFSMLKALYQDVIRLTEDEELFHIGGDEVDTQLWFNTSSYEALTTTTQKNIVYNDFFDTGYVLWVEVLRQLLNLLQSVGQPKYCIMWSSGVITSNQFLDNIRNNVIIQYWLGSLDFIKAYRYLVIFSDVNAWYLDCGFGRWSTKSPVGGNPCLYNSWHRFYMHSPWNQVDFDRVLGGEACLWSESVGEKSLDARIWPRTAAFAEAVWTAPHLIPDVINLEVFIRLDEQTQRLRSRGIKTQTLWPEWCTQHPGYCTQK